MLGEQVVCAFVGVLGLRSINLGYSRSIGDRVLTAVLERLTEAAGPRAMVARVGGTRFMVALPTPMWDAVRLEALLESFNAPIEVDLGDIRVRVAIGVWSGRSSDRIHLLDCAEETLRKAIRRGAGAVVVADDSSSRSARMDATIVSRFSSAHEEISAEFQPIVDMMSGQIVGLEALARWTSLDAGEIPPASWVPLAEHTGLIHDLGMQLLGTSLDFVEAARARGEWTDQYMAVNISPIQLERPGFVGKVLAMLAERDLPSSSLLLELTETDAITNLEGIAERLKLLHWHGVRTALDDFGTGIANFEHLRGVPIDTMKIGRQFIAGMIDGPLDRAIVRAVIAVACELGVTVVAKGVETEQQHAALLRFGCSRAQGFLYAGARPASTALEPIRLHPAPVRSTFPRPVDDEHRVRVLRSLCLLDSPPDAAFDRLAAAAAECCATPAAAVGLIDDGREWLKARIGVERQVNDRGESFSAHTICQTELLEVRDVTLDARFSRLAASRGPAGVRFYAGVPICTDDGYPMGALYVTDTVPRELTPKQRDGLANLAQHASLLLTVQRYRTASRSQAVALQRVETTSRHLAERLSLVVNSVTDGVVVVGEDGRVREIGQGTRALLDVEFSCGIDQLLWQLLAANDPAESELVERWFRWSMMGGATSAPLLMRSAGRSLTIVLLRSIASQEFVVLIRPASSCSSDEDVEADGLLPSDDQSEMERTHDRA